MSELRDELKHAFEMGKDSVINGPNEKNCHFTIFASVEGMRAWERGVLEAKNTIQPPNKEEK